MNLGSSVTTVRSDCPVSVDKFAQIMKIFMVIYKLVQSNSYATKRDIYYNDTQLFGSQRNVDMIVDDISCMLKVPRRSLHVFCPPSLCSLHGLLAEGCVSPILAFSLSPPPPPPALQTHTHAHTHKPPEPSASLAQV
ncbi:meiotic recombination protein SPO11-like [Notothenia coriiceps]|uniref:Meiotic recombination protein SPO11-like n=1 Tax=Notothenia coriiceps TaxID=8208 RepID=A0A6I9PDF0_9TELE|nr:PREDICTED: meiotic recombination protein SPO11-like [Notothenia coriiceps]